MIRIIAAVAAGLVAWFAIATVGNLCFRFAWAGYAAVEASMAFSLAMLLGRILLGVVSSLGGGAATAWIAKGNPKAAIAFGILLTLLFIPVHYRLWDKFALWYHVVFVASLFPCSWLGARLAARDASGRL